MSDCLYEISYEIFLHWYTTRYKHLLLGQEIPEPYNLGFFDYIEEEHLDLDQRFVKEYKPFIEYLQDSQVLSKYEDNFSEPAPGVFMYVNLESEADAFAILKVWSRIFNITEFTIIEGYTLEIKYGNKNPSN